MALPCYQIQVKHARSSHDGAPLNSNAQGIVIMEPGEVSQANWIRSQELCNAHCLQEIEREEI